MQNTDSEHKRHSQPKYFCFEERTEASQVGNDGGYTGIELGNQRLDALTTIESFLVNKGDPCKETLNVRAIMDAYRSCALVLDGQATYWGGGKLLEGPKTFSWDYFRRLNTVEKRAGGGFWVEGVFGPMPQSIKRTYKSAPAFKEGFELDHVVRFRSEEAHNETNAPEFEVRFVDDTGADTMMIFRDDVQRLMGNQATKDDWPWDHMMEFDLVIPSGLQKFAVLVIAVEVNMYNKRPEELGHRILMRELWTIVRCEVMFEHDSVDQNGRRRERLNGPWLRSSLFTATAPTDRKRLFVSTNKRELWAKSMRRLLTRRMHYRLLL
ncbi:hypothetical protein N7478_006633 [Penicillium angulare]|uniref:uncharacterized protein n=1 Tax=Penicillium angulare TaxID=116970 RepID=UPI002540FC04|nr:uncharacterized protein N7478_006633 [Penicillium angulare]KAJ5281261.1 hypothetical protein N7478_006633 [Penicillium angulare]